MKGHMAAAVRMAATLLGQYAELLDRNLQEFGIGRKDDVLGLHRGVHCDPGRIALIQTPWLHVRLCAEGFATI